MRVPIRLSAAHVPSSLRWGRVTVGDLSSLLHPEKEREFLLALSSLRFGRFFKTTSYGRLPLTLEALKRLKRAFSTICDVGASDGSASIALIQELKYDKYILIDRHPYVYIERKGLSTYAYDGSGRAIMRQMGPVVLYLDASGEWRTPGEAVVSWLNRARMSRSDLSEARKVALVNPALSGQLGAGIEVVEHDVTEAWPREKAELVVVANLLNKFRDGEDLLARAAKSLDQMLAPGGILALAENAPDERATLFEKSASAGRYVVVERVGGGSASEGALLGRMS